MVVSLLIVDVKPYLSRIQLHKTLVNKVLLTLLVWRTGYYGLAAYLSDKSLVERLNNTSLAGNINGLLETAMADHWIMRTLPGTSWFWRNL